MDINFSHEDQIAIEDALNQWNFSLNGVEKFVVNDDKFDMDPDEIKQIYEKNGVMILKIDSSNPQVESGDLAFVNDLGGDQIFVIRDRIDNERDLTGILLHEIGHILGAQHSTLGIMRPTYHSETVNCIDFFVIDQIAYKWGYDPMQFNYCVIN